MKLFFGLFWISILFPGLYDSYGQTGTRPLTRSNRSPCYSRTGEKIAFTSERDGNAEIYIMDADGGNQTRITRHDSMDLSPCWSPDGKRIAFFSKRDASYDLYTINTDGSDLVRITTGYEVIGKPLWMPDGKMIIFTGVKTGNTELYSIIMDTKQITNLTNHPGSDDGPALIPNSKRISFTSSRDTVVKNIHAYTMEIDGSDVRRLLPRVYERHFYLSWSPDGSKLAFAGQASFSDLEIYIISPDLRYKFNLSQNPNNLDTWPSWSPDGKKIVFASVRAGDTYQQIYSVNIDGSELKKLTF